VSSVDEAARDHAAIVDALRDGDADGVERAVAGDWRGAVERFAQVMTILGERGNW
jgi:DNA-binding GntR family transcriptional regulator